MQIETEHPGVTPVTERIDLRAYIDDAHAQLADANADDLLAAHKSLKSLYDLSEIELKVTAFDTAREAVLREHPELAIEMVDRYLADEEMHMDAYWALLDLWKHEEHQAFALDRVLAMLYHDNPDTATKTLEVVQTHLEDGDIFPEEYVPILREAIDRVVAISKW